jgi:enolase
VAALDDGTWAAARAAATTEGISVYVWLGRLVESAPWSNMAELEPGTGR